MSRPRYGYRRIHILLRREGRKVNHKKTYRLYKEERLSLRIPRKKRKYASVVRVPPRKPERPNELWAIDFMSDAQIDGRKFRVFTVIDVCSFAGRVGHRETTQPSPAFWTPERAWKRRSFARSKKKRGWS